MRWDWKTGAEDSGDSAIDADEGTNRAILVCCLLGLSAGSPGSFSQVGLCFFCILSSLSLFVLLFPGGKLGCESL